MFWSFPEGLAVADSPRLTLRVPKPLLAALEQKAKAAGLSLSDYARSLFETATGVSAGEMPQGFAAMSERKANSLRNKSAASRSGKKS